MQPIATHELWRAGKNKHSWDEKTGKVKILKADWSVSPYSERWLQQEGFSLIPIVVELENK